MTKKMQKTSKNKKKNQNNSKENISKEKDLKNLEKQEEKNTKLKNDSKENISSKKETKKQKENTIKENISEEKQENKGKKTPKKKTFKIILIIIMVICASIFGFSGYKIISWKIDNSKTQKLIDDLNSETKIKSYLGESENVEIITREITEDSIRYLAMEFIDVDLKDIKKENKETVGWIQVSGTKVNYPFVQTTNNSYYLSHSIDKSSNEAGWIFADTRNKLWTNKNTIIYGHGRLNKTMFGSLNDILDNDWTKNKDNFVIKISTEEENSIWQIFSVYHIKNSSSPDYSQINFKSNDEFLKFTKKLINRSMYNFNTTVNDYDQILTLSTCYNNSEKMVIHAKLIKKENKTISEKDE